MVQYVTFVVAAAVIVVDIVVVVVAVAVAVVNVAKPTPVRPYPKFLRRVVIFLKSGLSRQKRIGP